MISLSTPVGATSRTHRYHLVRPNGILWSFSAKKPWRISKVSGENFSPMMTSSNGNIFRVTGHLCGDSPVNGEFAAHWPVTRSFDVFFDRRLNERLSKQSWGWRFETPSRPFWRSSNAVPYLRIDRWGLNCSLAAQPFWYVSDCFFLSPGTPVLSSKACTRQLIQYKDVVLPA